MLDFIYYPVSWILWFWHRVFGFALGPDNGLAWAFSVVFLVFTLRLVLYKPFVNQVRTTRQMQELQPQIKELQRKYKSDRQKMATEMQKLQRENGFNPIMGCLPALAQVPVFIGLYHVLRSFNRTAGGIGQLHMTAAQNAQTPNYVFDAADVQSFLRARIIGAPISAAITTPKAQLAAFTDFGGIPHVMNMALVAVPLMIVAGLATHFNARASVARQSEAALANPQAAMMNKLALWVFPLGVLVSGPFLPIAILLYWVSNNIWTFGQQHLVFGRIDKEEEEKKRELAERRAQNAPKPGAKPIDPRKRPAASTESAGQSPAAESPAAESPAGESQASEATGVSTPDSTTDAESGKPTNTNTGSPNGSSGTPPKRSGPRPSGRPGTSGNRKRSSHRGRANQKRRR